MQKLITLLLAAGVSMTSLAQDKASYVNLFIGTGGHGHTHPAAIVPHGMIQPGPDTRHHGWDACSGYYYDDKTINGFTQTRLSGTGCADLGDFLLMPIVGKAHIEDVGDKIKNNQCAYASPFSHQNETAEPGYYSVWLDRYKIRTEITATERAALYRFTYPQAGEKGMIIDLDYNNQNQMMSNLDYKVINDSTLEIHHLSAGWAYHQPAYAYLKFSQPFQYEVVRDTIWHEKTSYPRCKVLLQFPHMQQRTLLVKLGFSFVDGNGAAYNLACELPDWNFEGTKKAARQLWNDELDKIEIKNLGKAATDSNRTIFYTALYHSHIAPQLFSDVDGRYLGMDLKIHQAPVTDPVYTVFSLWDTHRALHPLMSIIAPDKNEAYIRSLIRKGEEGGIVPKWELTGNYTGCMIGYHFASLLADTYLKGGHNFNIQKAYQQAIQSAEFNRQGITKALPRWKLEEIMPKARDYKNQLAYIPCDLEHESVAKGLEYAYDDWCIAQMAKALGDKNNENLFNKRATYYDHYFDSNVNFMRGKTSKGEWRTPFDPRSSDHRMDDYTEGNAWQWTWFVPHQPLGLVQLFGGKKPFTAKLDSLFTVPTQLIGNNVSPDISGLIGQYAHGNEPSHHIIYLYNYVQQPWKTQALADSILYGLYFAGPNGLSGNEDCGQMSAWYILNAAGFYQPCAGMPYYTLARPIFGEISFMLPQGKTFTIQTKNNSRENKYIKKVWLNGKIWNSPFFSHRDLMKGGTMIIEMTNRPSKWGTKAPLPTDITTH